MANKTQPIRFGLIGFGLFGKHHAAAITATAGAHLEAIAVKSEASQAAAREAHPESDIHGDYRALLDRDDIDVVSIVVPNTLHHQVARDALMAGKHLLLEKPMALRLAHCDELLKLAKEQNRTIAVNHELRLSKLWGGVKRLIDDGAIGRVQHAMIELSRFPYRPGAEGWRYDIDRVGSWVLEEPIHFLDLARWYLSSCGEPESVYARANSRHPHDPRLRDNFSAVVNFPNDAYAVVTQTLAAFGHHQSAKITGTAGTIWAEWGAADARSDAPIFRLRYGLGDEVHEIAFDETTGELKELADQVAAVVQCLKEGTPVPCSGFDGRASTMLCLAAEESIDSGKIVLIEEFAGDETKR